MISLKVFQNPENYPQLVDLVYHSMRNKYTSVSNPSGLTFNEVRSILKKEKEVTAIIYNESIIGIVRTSFADYKLKQRLELNLDIEYFNIGMIYISNKFRRMGIASEVISHFIKEHKNILYIVHKSNKSSNKVAQKYFNFFKNYFAFGSFESYNIYTLEQQ